MVDVYSDDFSNGPPSGPGNGSVMVASDVQVMPSVRNVRRDLAAIRSPRAESCFRQEFARMVAQGMGGVTVSGLQLQPFHLSAPGTDGSFGYHFAVVMTSGTQSMQVTGDELGFALGRAEVSLLTWAFGQPFPPTLEGHFFRLLTDRAVAHAG